MIKLIYINVSRYIFLFILRINLRKNTADNFRDLNFKENDFINYKIMRHYVNNENFIYNTSILDIHTFDFLFFFQKIGGKRGINLSKKNIFFWFKKYKYWNKFPWLNDFSSKRLINILYNYDFICSISNKGEIKTLNHIIEFHIKRIIFEIKRKKIQDISSIEILALVLIKCINTNLNKHTLNQIWKIIDSQIDSNSMHKSYNILEHTKFLNNLNEVKNVLLFFKIDIPNILINKILAMTSLLSNYRHEDFTLPLFNGCNNNYNNEIQKILDKEQFLKKNNLENFVNGIALYSDPTKTLFFDVVQPSNYGYNKELSAGSLSLEISSNGEKLITNCGGSESSGKNPAYLKYSAAHSTIIINNTNISEIKEVDFNKIYPKQVLFEKKDDDKMLIIEGTHNGYLKNYQKICKRKITIDKKNSIFRGEDTIISRNSIFEKNIYHIRFHLMPGLSITLTKNRMNVIIKTRKNNIWVFKADNEITLEKSIYVENDIGIETSQIVLNGLTSLLKNKTQWSLEKI